MQKIDVQQTPVDTAIASAGAVLRDGGLVIYPTETSYGIAADATNPAAIDRLRTYKGNRQNKPFSIIVADQTMAESYVSLTPLAQDLYRTYLPGPLTVISTGIADALAPGVMNTDGSVGIRIPKQELVLELVRQYGRPITATSANPSDEKPPYSAVELVQTLSTEQKSRLGLVLDAGQLPETHPTTIVDARGDQIQVLRQGGLRFAEPETLTTHSAEETSALGQNLIQKYKSFWGKSPVIFALSGEMGTGKTRFTKGLATGLGITDLIKSPSYALVHEHPFVLHGQERIFLHVDAWRLENPEELDALGLDQALENQAIVTIEWAQLSEKLLSEWQKEALIVRIQFQVGEAESERQLTMHTTFPEEKS